MKEGQNMSIKRIFIKVKGIVQGVGFRPFVYNTAKTCNLLGWVNNNSEGVYIDIEGTEQNINIFLPPNTNIYHANHLFKKMVNNCNQNNYIYKISNDKGGVRNELLIDPDFKEAFYKFCYKNT